VRAAGKRYNARMSKSEPKPILGPIAIESVPFQEWSQGARFGGRVRRLAPLFGNDYHVGVILEELPPGKQSAPSHYHLTEEEHIVMLEGAATLRLGEQEHPLKAGDYIRFPAGQAAGHCLVNRGETPCRYLVIGERKANDVVVYPDSSKLMVRGFGVFDAAARREYWDGERADEPHEHG
jgi:uncharacterized cupin superfamily protein